MKTKLYIIIISFFLLITFVLMEPYFLTNKNKRVENLSYIIWNENIKLKYENFEAEPDYSNKYDVSVYTFIQYRYQDSNEDTIIVEACIDKDSSWVKPKFIGSKQLLTHTQNQFDLTGYFARKLKKQINDYPKHKIKYLFSIIINELKIMQDKYNNETNFGLKQTEQKKWEKKIDKLLETLDAYKEKKVAIKKIHN